MKPYVDNYFSKQEEEIKIENCNKQSKHDEKEDISKRMRHISVPDADIKAFVYLGVATPKQLDRVISLTTKNESLEDQNKSEDQLTLITYDNYNEKTD